MNEKSKKMDLDKLIGKTNFTIGYIVRSLTGRDSRWDMLIERKRLQRVVIIPISDIGYLSYIYRIKFLFDDDIEKPFSVVLKV